MATTPPQIESFFYVGLAGFASVDITDGGGGPFTLTNTTTQPLSEGAPDVLTSWHTLANSHGTLQETYNFYWDATNQQVTLGATGTFSIDLMASQAAALGFTSASLSGASSYTSDTTPLAICNPLNIEYEAPKAAEETELIARRWCRVIARKHYRAEIVTLRIMMTSTMADAVLAGPLFTSKFRACPTGYTSGAYAGATSPRGYLDVFPYGMPETQKIGAGDGHTLVTVVGTVVE